MEEAKTTAKLQSETVQSTSSVQIPNNDLIKEFADPVVLRSRIRRINLQLIFNMKIALRFDGDYVI